MQSAIVLAITLFNMISEVENVLTRIKTGRKENIPKNLTSAVEVSPQLFNEEVSAADIKMFNKGKVNEDINLSIDQLIAKYGFPVETYQVLTEDGYILTLYRIPSSGKPALLFHGLLMSADDWVTPGVETGIAYALAKEGLDVWLGNSRGNKHSRRHQHLSPEYSKFWDFSWDEMGRYDLPAVIDFILNTTHYSQLIYVGHSQGTTSFFVMGSERPEYSEKVSLMIALAPVTDSHNLKSPFLLFLQYSTNYHGEIYFSTLRKLGFPEFLPDDRFIKQFRSRICGTNDLAVSVCGNLVFLICGFDFDQLNVTNLPNVFAHTPAGTSTKTLQHFAQVVTSKRFHKFNYDAIKNKILYGSKIPPEYNLGSINTPIALFYAENDWLATEKDVITIKNKLKNVVDFYKIPYKNFNHVDFLFGKDAKSLVTSRIIKLIHKTN